MRAISIGEILWDIIGGNEFLGGAPLNICAHLAQLGHQAYFVSAVGNDDRGTRALAHLGALGLTTDFVARTEQAATGISEVILDDGGRATHRLLRPAAYDFASLSHEKRRMLIEAKPDWICFGTLAQTETVTRSLTRQLIRDNPSAQRFYDVNLRPRCWSPELVEELFSQATAVKLNDDEAARLATLFDWPLESYEQFATLAARRWSLNLICITRGPEGCAVWRDGEYIERPGFEVQVADTVGAGDAFSAALLHGLQQAWRLSEIADFANRVGALVASRPGAIPNWTVQEAEELDGKRHDA